MYYWSGNTCSGQQLRMQGFRVSCLPVTDRLRPVMTSSVHGRQQHINQTSVKQFTNILYDVWGAPYFNLQQFIGLFHMLTFDSVFPPGDQSDCSDNLPGRVRRWSWLLTIPRLWRLVILTATVCHCVTRLNDKYQPCMNVIRVLLFLDKLFTWYYVAYNIKKSTIYNQYILLIVTVFPFLLKFIEAM